MGRRGRCRWRAVDGPSERRRWLAAAPEYGTIAQGESASRDGVYTDDYVLG